MAPKLNMVTFNHKKLALKSKSFSIDPKYFGSVPTYMAEEDDADNVDYNPPGILYPLVPLLLKVSGTGICTPADFLPF